MFGIIFTVTVKLVYKRKHLHKSKSVIASMAYNKHLLL
jgi:hypothetical protein